MEDIKALPENMVLIIRIGKYKTKKFGTIRITRNDCKKMIKEYNDSDHSKDIKRLLLCEKGVIAEIPGGVS